ncbi:PREDICTED: cell differentiation protein RCD1 homolog [Ipomoea nil]|uniref:cell differentiation protein RCD1 homolog n=1 Tax=Ipomoea nil TaxID=35883 RepID=UPI000900D1C3|nr:PREDICTED: cell differentiation protein RCD1 homolog [Ipomoea nil]
MANLLQDASMSCAAGVQPYNGGKVQSAEELLIDICNPQLRENALRELCTKHREELFQVLAPSIWKSFGTVAALIMEIVSIYRLLPSPELTLERSNTVCNALIVLQSLAVNPETRIPFLDACIPYYVYPFLKLTSHSTPLEKLRISSLGIICGIVKEGETKAIKFLLVTEVMPLCLSSMDIGDTLSKQAATFILQKMLSHDMGLEYICTTVARFLAVVQTLKNMVVFLSEKPSSELLKHIIQCYIRLCDDSRARDKIRYYLPDRLKDATFSNCFEEDPDTKMSLQCLLCIVNNA